MAVDDLDIAFAVVEILQAHAGCLAWATGGIHVGRVAQEGGRADKYIVVSIVESGELDPVQDAATPVTLVSDTVEVAVWASSAADAAKGENRARWALDRMEGTAAGIAISRIDWLGAVHQRVEDAAGAEQEIIGKVATYSIKYRLPVEA